MRFMRSSNPAMRGLSRFQDAESIDRATYGGIAIKTLTLVFFAVLSALFSAYLVFTGNAIVGILMIVGIIGGLVFGLICSFAPNTAHITAPLYALCYGLLLGVISSLFNAMYQGIVMSALVATLVVLGVMMILYYTGTIRVGSKFRRFMMVAMISALVSLLLFWILSMVSSTFAEMYHGNGSFALLVSIIMILLASFMLLIDLDNITITVESGMSKRAEWYAAFGLTVTLIWLYVEFLRLLAILNSRR